MAIAFNAKTELATTTSEASWSLNHTCAGSDRLLLVFVSVMRGTADGIAVSTCTFGGTNMTQAATRGWNDTNRSRTYRQSIYYMVAPGTSEAAVAVTTSVNSTATVIVAVSLTGVLQTGTIGNTAGSDLVLTTAASQALTTTAANSWIVGGVNVRQPNSAATTFSPGTDTNEWYDLSSGDTATSDISTTGGYKLVATAGASSIEWTASNAIYGVMVAVEVKAAGAATQDIAPSGLAVTVGVGTAVVTRGTVSVAPSGKAVGIASGTAVVGRGAVAIAPSGLAVAVGVGTAVIGRGAVAVAPSGKAVGLGLGTPSVGVGVQNVAPAGLSAAVGLGTAVVGRGAVSVAPAGKAVAVGLGAASVAFHIAPAGLAVGVGVGTAVIGRGVATVAPSGLAVGAAFGTAVVGTGEQDIAPAGLAVAVGLGAAAVVGPQSVAPSGLAVGSAIGAPHVVLPGIGLYGVATTTSSETASEWSLTATSGGVNRFAIVIAHILRDVANDNYEIAAVYGGATMVPLILGSFPDSTRTRTYGVYIYGLVAPPAGEQTVTVTMEEDYTAVAAVVTVLTLANVNQALPTGGTGKVDIIGATTASARVYSSLSEWLPAGSWLVGGVTMRGGDLTFTPGTGMTEVYDLPSGSDVTLDLSATGGYLPVLTAAAYRDWISTANALDYGVAAAVEVRRAMVVYPRGLALGAVPGAVLVELGAIAPAGLAVAAGIGEAVVGQEGTLIAPAGLALGALGEPTVEIGGVTVAAPSVAVPLELGAAAVAQVMTAEGLAVALAIGDGALAGSSSAVAPAGLAVGVGMGAARVWSHRLIVAVAEDGYETPAGVVFLNTTSLNVEVNQPWVAMATAALDVPQGVTVVTTRLNLQTISHDDPQLEAACELDAAPATLTTAANNISGRSLTVARARWEAANVGLGVVNSPNFGAAAQEVVLLPEWEPGGRLMFVLRDLTAGGWLRWYSADAAAGLRPTVTVEWQFGAADLTLEPSGLAVAAAMGEAVVGGGAVGVTADGLAVAVGIGGAVVGGGAVGIVADGLAVTLALGEAVVTGGALDIAPEGLASFVVVGDAALGQLVAPAGLGLGAIGSVTVSRATIGIVVEGVAVGLGLGEAVVLAGGALLRPAGVAAAAAFGTAVVGRGGVGVTAEALGVGVASGTAVVGLGGVGIAPEGVAAAVAFGTAVVGSGVATVAAGGLPVTVGSGAAAVGHGLVVDGLAVGMTSGTAVMGNGVAVGGLAVGVTSGSADVAITLQRVTVGGLSVGALVGLAMVALARQPWPLTVRPRSNGLTLAERDNGLTLRARDNELTVEDRME